MLQLADVKDEAEYKEAYAAGELRHLVLASLRVRIKRKAETPRTELAAATEHSEATTSNDVSAIIVEAEPLREEPMHEIPKDSVEVIVGLLAAWPAPTSERFTAAPLQNLEASPFYNIVIDGEP